MNDCPLTVGANLDKAAVSCVFLHGRGQSPELMVEQVIARLRVRDVSYLLPRAPGPSWYEARAIDPVVPDTARQLEAALDAVDEAIAEAGANKLVLAGFSQGACLALEHLARRRPAIDGFAALTGCRVGGVTADPFPGDSLKGLPAYISNGRDDPWIPLREFFHAGEQLAAAGASLRMEVIPERQHEVSNGEAARLDDLLACLVAGTPASSERRAASQ